MNVQPIRVVVSVGAAGVREITLVGDAADSMLAVQVGNAVAVAIIEMGSTP